MLLGAIETKLRFKDTDYCDWKQLSLCDVLHRVKSIRASYLMEKEVFLVVRLHCRGVVVNDMTFNSGKISGKGRPYYRRRKGELLISRYNFHNGGLGVVNEELDGGLASSAILSYLPRRDIIDVMYLLYFISRKSYYKKSAILLNGSCQRELKEEDFKKLPIYLPCLEEQKRIVSFLKKIDLMIDLISKNNKLLEQYKKGIMSSLFLKKYRFKNSKGNNFRQWNTVLLAKLGKIVTGNTPNKCYMRSKDSYPWITVRDFVGKYLHTSKNSVSKQEVKKERVIPKGSLLVVCITTIGVSAIAKVDLLTNQQVNSIVLNDSCYNEYLYYYLMYHHKKLFQSSNQTTVPIITKNSFLKIEIELPAFEEQILIGNFLRDIDKKIEKNKSLLNNVCKFRERLSNVLM